MSHRETPRRRGNLLRGVLLAAAGAAAVVFLLFWLVQSPFFLRHTVLPLLGRRLDCSVKAKHIAISFCRGTLSMQGLQISDGSSFRFHAASFESDLAVLPLFAGIWEIETAAVNRAELELSLPQEADGNSDADPENEKTIPLAEENLFPLRIRHAEITDFTFRYRTGNGPQTVSFSTSEFTLKVDNWGIPDAQAAVQGNCPFELRIPNSATLRGGRAKLALNARFDGGALPREFSLSLGTGCLVSFAGETRELPQNLVLRARGSIDRSGKAIFDAFSLQQHTGGEITACINGSSSFGPAADDFLLKIDKFQTLPQFWSVVPPLAGYQVPGRFTLSGSGNFSLADGIRECSFSFSGSRAAENDFPGITFSSRGSMKMDQKKQRTHFSELALDAKETKGQGLLKVRLARPMDYIWGTGIGGAVVNIAIRKMPLAILRDAIRGQKDFPVRSGECNGNLRAVFRRDLRDFGATGMLSCSGVVLHAGKRNIGPLNGEFLLDFQSPKLKKLAGSVWSEKVRLLKVSGKGEYGKDQKSGNFSLKGVMNAMALLRLWDGKSVSARSGEQTDFLFSGAGGDGIPLKLKAELHRFPFVLLPLPQGWTAQSGLLQSSMTFERKNAGAPGHFRFAAKGDRLSFRRAGTLHQGIRANVTAAGKLEKDRTVCGSGTFFAAAKGKKILDLTLKKTVCSHDWKTLDTSVLLRHCDIGMFPVPSDCPVNRGILSGTAALSYSPEKWSVDGKIQTRGIAGKANLPVDGQIGLRASGAKKKLLLHSLLLDLHSQQKKILALTAEGSFAPHRKGRFKADSTMLDLDFLKKFCGEGTAAKKDTVPEAVKNGPPCRLDDWGRWRGDFHFRKVLMGKAYGTLECHADSEPGKIMIRSYALSFNGVPVRGTAFLANAERGVRCQLIAKVDRPLELRPVLQFFVPESLQRMRCQLERADLLCQGTLPQWELWREHLNADLHAGFGECVIPDAFGKGTFGRIILMPFEAIRKMNSKVTVGEPAADESFMESLQGIQRSARSVRFSRGTADIRLRTGTLHVRQFRFKGDLVKDFRINGTIQLTGKQQLNLQTNTRVSGMDFPLLIGGTLEKPELKAGKSTTDIVVKNTENLWNSLKDKVDWDTTLQ